MRERLLQFLQEESLTPAKFADDIGVQRSNVSHILSGRKNPGFDFIQKILKKYTHVNAEWLILGTGNPYKPLQQGSLFDLSPSETHSASEEMAPAAPPAEKSTSIPEIPPGIPSLENQEPIPAGSSKSPIEKVIILYQDKTFREYRPE